MPIIDGINVVGYQEYGSPGQEFGTCGMQTCGQIEIGNFSGWTDKETPLAWIEKNILPKMCNQQRTNIVFSITGEKILSGAHGLLKYLLKHPNTRIMHWYKNDAHGPNWIFLCIYHHWSGVLDNASPGYKIEDIKKRFYWSNGGYTMKDK